MFNLNMKNYRAKYVVKFLKNKFIYLNQIKLVLFFVEICEGFHGNSGQTGDY